MSHGMIRQSYQATPGRGKRGRWETTLRSKRGRTEAKLPVAVITALQTTTTPTDLEG